VPPARGAKPKGDIDGGMGWHCVPRICGGEGGRAGGGVPLGAVPVLS